MWRATEEDMHTYLHAHTCTSTWTGIWYAHRCTHSHPPMNEQVSVCLPTASAWLTAPTLPVAPHYSQNPRFLCHWVLSFINAEKASALRNGGSPCAHCVIWLAGSVTKWNELCRTMLLSSTLLFWQDNWYKWWTIYGLYWTLLTSFLKTSSEIPHPKISLHLLGKDDGKLAGLTYAHLHIQHKLWKPMLVSWHSWRLSLYRWGHHILELQDVEESG